MLGSAFAGSRFRVHGSTFEVRRLLCGPQPASSFSAQQSIERTPSPRLLKKVQMQGGTP